MAYNDFTMARHFYNNRDYTLDEQRKIVILNDNFHKKLLAKKLWNKFGFKKIGGSSIADVLEIDDFKSQFLAFCRIAWIAPPIMVSKYIDAGVAIEPMVIDSLKKHWPKIEIHSYSAQDYNYDYFAGINPIIGGVPDGYIPSKEIVLEIKTTGEKNFESWSKNGVPLAYLKQAQLYTYLMNKENFWIVATFLKEDDYVNPKKYPIEKRIIKNFAYKIDKAQVENDLSLVFDWYKKYTKIGHSPVYDEIKDKDLIDYLRCSNEKEYLELIERWKKEGKADEKFKA